MSPWASARGKPRRQRAAIAIAALALALLIALVTRTARAHPAGFTSVNRYLGVACEGRGLLRMAYVLDFAEMPSYAELEDLDANHDGAVSPDEQRAYLDKRLPPLIRQWVVEVDGERVTPKLVASRLDIRDGERGLSIVRIEAEVDASFPPRGGDVHVDVWDLVFSDRAGWREIAANDSPEWAVTSGPKQDPSKALDYAAGGRIPRVDRASFGFRRRASSSVPPSQPRLGLPFAVDPRLAKISRAIRSASGGRSFSLIAIALALLLGTAHALSPGHGKTLAAAYLAGNRACAWQAVLFGTTVTVAHTAIVFVVGSLAVAIEHTVGSDRLMRALELLAAVTVLLLGAVQLARHWRSLLSAASDHEHTHAGASTGDLHSVLALGASAGLTPCPSALAVLLTAVAVHRYAFGLILVLAFSAGIAVTLTTTGLLVVLARRMLDRMTALSKLLRWLPILSSACMLVIGVILCASAL